MNDQLDGDLETARQIRTGLLPPSVLRFGQWEVAGCMVPLQVAPRNSFDYFRLGDGCYAIWIAEVLCEAGRSTQVVSDLHSSLRADALAHLSVPETMQRLNESMAQSGAFASVCYGEFDSERRVLRYSRGGHPFPLLRRRDGSLVDLSEGGPLLGFLENVDYSAAELVIEVGDSLLLYCAGLTNALDPLNLGWGLDRLRAIWRRRGGIAPGEAIAAILADVQAFRDRALVGKIETFPTLAEAAGNPGLTHLGLLRMEAHQLRGRAAPLDEMTLVVLGMHEQP